MSRGALTRDASPLLVRDASDASPVFMREVNAPVQVRVSPFEAQNVRQGIDIQGGRQSSAAQVLPSDACRLLSQPGYTFTAAHAQVPQSHHVPRTSQVLPSHHVPRPVHVAMQNSQQQSWCRGAGAAASGDQMESMSTGNFGIAHQTLAAGLTLAEASHWIQVVSVGSYCGAKLSLRRLGFGEAHMPFDWMRTTVYGLLHWLRHDFEGFMDWTTRLEVVQSGQRMTVYRTQNASFWHDDLEDEVDREKLRRRIQRFLNLGKADSNRALLFIRSAAGTDEIKHSEMLLALLQERFQSAGRRVFLLVILEDQPLVGPVLHSQIPELLFWVQPLFTGKLSPYLDAPAPFEEAVTWAVRRMLGDPLGLYPTGRPDGVEQWPIVRTAADILSPAGELMQAGFRESPCGIWAGGVQLNGMTQEVMLAAFDGLDGLSGRVGGGVAQELPAGGYPFCAPAAPYVAAY